MCLAVPGKVIECHGDEVVADLQGSRVRASRIMTPGVAVGDWVLIHAGFAIAQLSEAEAQETWDCLRQVLAADEVDPGETGLGSAERILGSAEHATKRSPEQRP